MNEWDIEKRLERLEHQAAMQNRINKLAIAVEDKSILIDKDMKDMLFEMMDKQHILEKIVDGLIVDISDHLIAEEVRLEVLDNVRRMAGIDKDR